MKIPDRVRYINKRFTNHLMVLIACRKGSSIAVMRHSGRRSGKRYAIPVMAAPITGGFVIALTYGDHVDWYRNILAAGEGTLVWFGREYLLDSPLTIPAEEGCSSFPHPWRFMLNVMRTADYFRMTTQK